jgi:hypothetical protein
MVALTRVIDKFSRLKSGDGVEFSFKDTGASKISKQLDILNGHVITIGFQGSTALVKYPGGPNVATVAMFNEFGTENMPERQFMRRTVSANRQKIGAESARLLGQVATLKLGAMEALDQLGRFVAEAMSAQIDQSKRWATPNAPSTADAKGGDQPLVDTGLMQESITWAIRKGSELGPIVKEGKV